MFNNAGIFASTDRQAHQVPDGLAGVPVIYKSAGQSPLVATLSKRVTRGYMQTRVEWTEKAERTGYNYIVANQGNPLGSYLSLADTSTVQPQTMLQVMHTGEMLLVTGITSNGITVIRGFGGTEVMPIAPTNTQDIPVLRIGTAFPENSERVTSGTTYQQQRYNYTQIFRNGWAASRSALQQGRKGQSLIAELKSGVMHQHVKDIDTTMALGVRSIGKQGDMPIRTMDGILRQIRTNIAKPADGLLTFEMLDFFISTVYATDVEGFGNDRLAIVGAGFMRLLNQLIAQTDGYQFNVNGSDNYYGLNVTTIATSVGNIKFMVHPALAKMPNRTNDLWLIHPDSIDIYYMYEASEENGYGSANNGIDGSAGGLITEATVTLRGELASGILTGICGINPRPKRVELSNWVPPVANGGC